MASLKRLSLSDGAVDDLGIAELYSGRVAVPGVCVP